MLMFRCSIIMQSPNYIYCQMQYNYVLQNYVDIPISIILQSPNYIYLPMQYNYVVSKLC
jgi:predicted aldo/keto reductase-like oxidoreductase